MRINFEAKKLKEANAYVNLLTPKKAKHKEPIKKENKSPFFKRIFGFLFR